MTNKDLITGRHIVITGQQPWDTPIGSNCKNIAVEFSRHNKVLYVNSPLDRNTLLRRRHDPAVQKRLAVIEGRISGLEQISDRLWTYYPDRMLESINWIRSRSIFNRLNRYNNRRFAQTIEKAIATLAMKDIIHFNDNDIFRSFHLKALLRPVVSVYYSRDYMLSSGYWRRHGLVMEPTLIAQSDVCVANSSYLANYCRQYNPLSFDVGQGCEVDFFAAGLGSPIPEDIRHLSGPIIGYVGALQSSRLDIPLLEHLAALNTNWTWVFVGPEDDQFRGSKLHEMRNVCFTGSRDFHDLPAYINAFDVCINPQVVNEMTIGNYPRKIDEYLALGKPVVATKTEAMNIFNNHTYQAVSKEDYSTLIAQALSQDSVELQQSRRALAATHTWESSVAAIYRAIRCTGHL